VRFKEQKNYFAFLNILKIDTSGKFDKTFWGIFTLLAAQPESKLKAIRR
jgi:hypothetical protein